MKWSCGSGLGLGLAGALVAASVMTAVSVDARVKRLRVRLGEYGHAIETVHGKGYRLRPPA